MKNLLFALCALFPSAYAAAGEPWVDTRPGAEYVYEVSTGGFGKTTVTKRVASFEEGVVTLQIDQAGATLEERWAVGPDSTVLRMTAPQQMYDLLRGMGVERISVSSRDMILPADMQPGDRLPDYYFELAGEKDDVRTTVSVTMTDIRVAARERLKTRAGTFDTLRIEMTSTVDAAGERQQLSMTQWFAPNVGLVRQTIPVPMLNVERIQELKKINAPAR